MKRSNNLVRAAAVDGSHQQELLLPALGIATAEQSSRLLLVRTLFRWRRGVNRAVVLVHEKVLLLLLIRIESPIAKSSQQIKHQPTATTWCLYVCTAAVRMTKVIGLP